MMAQERVPGMPVMSVVDEDPVEAIRNACQRMRTIADSAACAGPAGVVLVTTQIEEELDVVDAALRRLQPT